MRYPSSQAAGKEEASRGWAGSSSVPRRTRPAGSGIAEKGVCFAPHVLGQERAHVLVCTCVCAACVQPQQAVH